MPLIADVLYQGLLLVDQPPSPSPEVTAQRWATAVANYAQTMSLLNPGTAAAAVASGASSFVSVYTPVIANVGALFPAWATGLQAALTSFWLAAGVPANLMPPVTAVIPNPAPLFPLLSPLIPVGMADSTPNGAVVKRQLANLLDVWTRLCIGVVPDAPPVPFT